MVQNFYQEVQGFTLIEILIVVTIIGVLSALVLPRFFVNLNDADIATCKSNLSSLNEAISRYMYVNGGLPLAVIGDLIPNYLERVPKCPVGKSTGAYLIGTDNLAICSNGHTL